MSYVFTTYTLVAVLVFYLSLVQYFIYQRGVTLQRKRNDITTRAAYIVLYDLLQDFSVLFYIGGGIGLFYTFGIPTMSKLLHETRQFEHKCAKRFLDTDFILRHIFTPEHRAPTIKRLNQIHNHYGDKISNDDKIYTIAVLFLIPLSLITRYGFREVTKFERECLALVIKSLSKEMEIDLTGVECSENELRNWVDQYERDYMIYHENNQYVAEGLMNFLQQLVPSWFQFFIRNLLISQMKPCLQRALFPSRSYFLPIYKLLGHAVFTLWWFLTRFFCIAKSRNLLLRCEVDPTTKRMDFIFEPLKWLGIIPRNLYSNGHFIHELGPTHILPPGH